MLVVEAIVKAEEFFHAWMKAFSIVTVLFFQCIIKVNSEHA
jgi:hypothetical protein